MTKEELKMLQMQHKESGMSLLQFLQIQSIKYNTYRYWCRKYERESEEEDRLLAPISFQSLQPKGSGTETPNRLDGITLALPNGIQAHFSPAMSEMALQFLTRSLPDHVLSE